MTQLPWACGGTVHRGRSTGLKNQPNNQTKPPVHPGRRGRDRGSSRRLEATPSVTSPQPRLLKAPPPRGLDTTAPHVGRWETFEPSARAGRGGRMTAAARRHRARLPGGPPGRIGSLGESGAGSKPAQDWHRRGQTAIPLLGFKIFVGGLCHSESTGRGSSPASHTGTGCLPLSVVS